MEQQQEAAPQAGSLRAMCLNLVDKGWSLAYNIVGRGSMLGSVKIPRNKSKLDMLFSALDERIWDILVTSVNSNLFVEKTQTLLFLQSLVGLSYENGLQWSLCCLWRRFVKKPRKVHQ